MVESFISSPSSSFSYRPYDEYIDPARTTGPDRPLEEKLDEWDFIKTAGPGQTYTGKGTVTSGRVGISINTEGVPRQTTIYTTLSDNSGVDSANTPQTSSVSTTFETMTSETSPSTPSIPISLTVAQAPDMPKWAIIFISVFCSALLFFVALLYGWNRRRSRHRRHREDDRLDVENKHRNSNATSSKARERARSNFKEVDLEGLPEMYVPSRAPSISEAEKSSEAQSEAKPIDRERSPPPEYPGPSIAVNPQEAGATVRTEAIPELVLPPPLAGDEDDLLILPVNAHSLGRTVPTAPPQHPVYQQHQPPIPPHPLQQPQWPQQPGYPQYHPTPIPPQQMYPQNLQYVQNVQYPQNLQYPQHSQYPQQPDYPQYPQSPLDQYPPRQTPAPPPRRRTSSPPVAPRPKKIDLVVDYDEMEFKRGKMPMSILVDGKLLPPPSPQLPESRMGTPRVGGVPSEPGERRFQLFMQHRRGERDVNASYADVPIHDPNASHHLTESLGRPAKYARNSPDIVEEEEEDGEGEKEDEEGEEEDKEDAMEEEEGEDEDEQSSAQSEDQDDEEETSSEEDSDDTETHAEEEQSIPEDQSEAGQRDTPDDDSDDDSDKGTVTSEDPFAW